MLFEKFFRVSQDSAWIFIQFFEQSSQFKQTLRIFSDINDLKFDIILVQIFQNSFGFWTAVVMDNFYHDALKLDFGDFNFCFKSFHRKII